MGKAEKNHRTYRRPRSVDWKVRHSLVIIVTSIGVLGFLESRAEWSEMHRWNRAVGDMSLVLIAVSMALGPLTRLWRVFSFTVPWRRELGVYGVILAIIHTVIILSGWVEWDLVRLFGYELHPVSQNYVMFQHGFGLANIIGIVGLVYGLVLAASSNDLSLRFLTGSVWKFLQQGAYVFWVLILVHTAYFLFIHFQDFHREVPDPNWVQMPFVWLILFVFGCQISAFVKTWKARGKLKENSDRREREIG